MSKDRKYLVGFLVFAVVVIVVSALAIYKRLDSDSSPAPVTTTATAPATTVPVTTKPPASTVTVTVTPTPKPSSTPPPAKACIQDDLSTKGWDDTEDNTSEGSDSRPGVMALGNVNGVYWQAGICFDTMVIKTDTDEAVGFDVQYVDASELTGIASGIPVDVQGKAFLKFVVTAHIGEESANPFDGNVVFSPHGDRFQAIQDVKYLGYQEGRLAFAVGVSDRLPIAATREANPDQAGTVAIALHIAHH